MPYHIRTFTLTAAVACFLSLMGCSPVEQRSPQEKGIPVEGMVSSPYGREDLLKAFKGNLQRWNAEEEKLENVDAAYLADKEYLVLYFSASWCPPCVWFSPILEKFYRHHAAPRRFEVILVGNDRSEEAHDRYVAKLDPSYPVLKYDAELESDALMQYAESLSLPGLRVIDRNGRLVLTTEPSRNMYVSPEQVLKTLSSWLVDGEK
jgi:thiol-disulfide isomerase/thioredoxin